MSEIIAGVEVPETAAVAESTRLLQESTRPLLNSMFCFSSEAPRRGPTNPSRRASGRTYGIPTFKE